jgi:uncharacterized BrkB/YihY/UPF0761 family membrane protein
MTDVLQSYVTKENNVVLLTNEFILVGLSADDVKQLDVLSSFVTKAKDGVIPIKAISKIESDQNDNITGISYQVNAQEKFELLTMSEETNSSFIKDLSEYLKNDFDYFEKKDNPLSFGNPLVIKILLMFGAAICIMMAMFKGQTAVTRRTAGITFLLNQFLKLIGPIPFATIIGLVLLFFVYRLIKEVRNPHMLAILSRKR